VVAACDLSPALLLTFAQVNPESWLPTWLLASLSSSSSSSGRSKRNQPKKQHGVSVLDTVGNTPLIYLASLSEQTGCKIYGKAGKPQGEQWAWELHTHLPVLSDIGHSAHSLIVYTWQAMLVQSSSTQVAASRTGLLYILWMRPWRLAGEVQVTDSREMHSAS
jgi:hypothetical protein